MPVIKSFYFTLQIHHYKTRDAYKTKNTTNWYSSECKQSFLHYVFAFNFREICYGNYSGCLESIKMQMEYHMDFKEGELIIISENYRSSQGQRLLPDSLADLSEHPQQGGNWAESCWAPWTWDAPRLSHRWLFCGNCFYFVLQPSLYLSHEVC